MTDLHILNPLPTLCIKTMEGPKSNQSSDKYEGTGVKRPGWDEKDEFRNVLKLIKLNMALKV